MIKSIVLFQFETSEQCTFFSENVAVNLYPVNVVALAFEETVAIMLVVSISCDSDSH